MLGWLIEKTKMAKLAGQWYDATGLNPGDRGQIGTLASSLIKNKLFRVEDAWLAALVNWTFNSPHPEFKFLLANGILRFLDIYEYIIPFDPELRVSARQVANTIVGDGVLSGYPDSASKNYFPKTLLEERDITPRNLPPGTRVSLASSTGCKDEKPLSGLAKELYDKMLDDVAPEASLAGEPPNILRNPPISTLSILAEKTSGDFKTCCHCGRQVSIEAEVCDSIYCGLDPDQETMKKYGINFENGKYKFIDHYFSKRRDAIKFAKMKIKN